MLTLKADNRSILRDTKYSYLVDNNASGTGSIIVSNSSNFNPNDFLIIGNIGSESTEIAQVDTITSATNTLVLVSNTKFAHSESTRVTAVLYNQVQFYWTAAPTVPNPVPITSSTIVQNKFITSTEADTITQPTTAIYTKITDPSFVQNIDITPPITIDFSTPLTLSNLQVDNFFTTYNDSIHATGYGWFAFFNSTTLLFSAVSNPIPYGGFDLNTVKEVFSGFDSCLNQKELKLISNEDRYSWLNEGFSRMVNELNLGNWEYNSSGPLLLNIKSGITEYLLPPDFSNLLYINEFNTDPVLGNSGDKILEYEQTFEQTRTSSARRYQIRGRYVVFFPTPQSDGQVVFAYLKNAGRLKQLSDVVDLPDNAYQHIKDFMLFRAYRKLGNLTESNNSLAIFNKAVENMKIYSIKRDNGLDSWTLPTESNV